jgi:hypothetical protein
MRQTYRKRAEWYREWAKLAGSPEEREERERLAEYFEQKVREREDRSQRPSMLRHQLSGARTENTKPT